MALWILQFEPGVRWGRAFFVALKAFVFALFLGKLLFLPSAAFFVALMAFVALENFFCCPKAFVFALGGACFQEGPWAYYYRL